MEFIKCELIDDSWLGGHSQDLLKFRGEIQDNLSLLDSQIRGLLEHIQITPKKYFWSNLELLLRELSTKVNKKEKIKLEKIKRNFNDLNTIRVYCAHAMSLLDGRRIALLVDGKEEALLFDTNLIREQSKLFNKCLIFLTDLEMKYEIIDLEDEDSA